MTREDLVRKKLAHIESFLGELEAQARTEAIESDVVQQRFVERTLQIAIQAALDVASHIVAEDRLGEPKDNGELFELLAGRSWISRELAGTLKRVVGFRNLLVHGYADVDLAIVRDVAEHRTGDLRDFVRQIRERLDGG